MKNTLIVMFFLAVASSGLMATDIFVQPGENTITTALATAEAGDRLVLVQEGVYSNDPLFVYKPITIAAFDGLATKPIVSFLYSTDTTDSIFALLERTLVFTYASMTLEGVEFTMESDFDHGLPTRMFRNRAYKDVNWKFTDCLFRDASQATMSITGVLDSFMVADGSWHYDSLDYVENASFIVDGDTIAQPGLHGVLDTLIIDNCVFNNFLLGGPKINHKPGHGRGVYSYIQFTNNTVSNTDHHTISFAMRDVDEGSDNSLYGTAVIDHNTIHGIAGGSKNAIQLKYVNSASTIMNTTITDVGNQAINVQNSDSVLVDYSNWYSVGSGPVQQWTDGGHNLQVDPLFADASTGDLTLPETSPLVGAGSNGSTIGDPRWAPDISGNLAPVAVAGADIVIESDDGSETVTLDGSGSYDPNGNALTYSWTLDGTVVSTDVSFDYDLNIGVFTFTLTVSNGELTDSDDVVVTVNSSTNGDDNVALSFTAANEDYIDCGNDPELQLGTHDLTVEFWFKTSAGGVKRIVGNGGTTTSDDGYSIWILGNGKIRASFSDGTTSEAKQNETVVSDGDWHHCAVVFDRDDVLWVCVDGTCATKPIDTLSDLNCDNTNDTFVLGRKSTTNSAQSYTGSLDEVRIWNTALDTATVFAWRDGELTSLHPNISNLQAYYKFNENSGSTANDLTADYLDSYESDGTITGAEWVASDIPNFTLYDDEDLQEEDSAPSAPSLTSPSDSLAISLTFENLYTDSVVFVWESSADPDGDAVMYRAKFGHIVYSGETLLDTVKHDSTMAETSIVVFYEDFNEDLVDLGGDNSVLKWNVAAIAGSDTVLSDNGPRFVLVDGTSLSVDEEFIPTEFALHQNYPNPFNPVTTLNYGLPEQSMVVMTVYDLMGREVTTLVNQVQKAGYHTIRWNGTDQSGQVVSAGLYIYRITAGDYSVARKMILLK